MFALILTENLPPATYGNHSGFPYWCQQGYGLAGVIWARWRYLRGEEVFPDWSSRVCISVFCIFQSDKRSRASARTVNESHTTQRTSVHTRCPRILASKPDLLMLRCDVMCERAESCPVLAQNPPEGTGSDVNSKNSILQRAWILQYRPYKSMFRALKSPVRTGTGELGWLRGHTLTQPRQLLCVF